MTKNLESLGLRSIIKDYDLIFIDIWGVVHNGIKLNQKAIQAIKEIEKANKIISFLRALGLPIAEYYSAA